MLLDPRVEEFRSRPRAAYKSATLQTLEAPTPTLTSVSADALREEGRKEGRTRSPLPALMVELGVMQ